MSEKKPNILLFITHDTGRHLGCYGRGPATPNLDRIAAEGACFTRAYCTAPQCSPSRASLMTGLYPHSHGLIGLLNRGFQRTPGIPALPQILAGAGYATHLFGFQHEARDPSTLGYGHVHGARKSCECKDVVPHLIAFLDSAENKADPFFASVSVRETHRAFPRVEGCRGRVVVPSYLPDVEEIRRDIVELNAVVETVDDAAGEICTALERNGFEENTLLIFTTDHGIAFPGAKATLFEAGLEIALLMRGPREMADGAFRCRGRLDAPVSNVDLLPTLLEACGEHDRIPGGLHGTSLLPLLRGSAEVVHEKLYFEQTYHSGYDPLRAILKGRYKLIRSFEFRGRSFYFARNVDGSPSKDYLLAHSDVFRRPRPEVLLFDLAADPDERTNLAEDRELAATRDALLADLEDWMRRTDDPLQKGIVPPPPEAVVASDDQFDSSATRLSAEEYCRRRGWRPQAP